LEAGLPLAIVREDIRSTLGFLFGWKMANYTMCVILLSMAAKKAILPVFYALLVPFIPFLIKSVFYRMEVSHSKVLRCGKCKSTCPVDSHHI
jgi:Na+/H+-translocating membrane pyrophosphatase